MYDYLILKTFPKGNTIWLRHGETNTLHTTVETPTMPQPNEDKVLINDPICDMINDTFGHHPDNNDMEEDKDVCLEASQTMSDDIIELLEVMRDGEQSLYKGFDKYSKLSFLTNLYHIKCLCRMSNKVIPMTLELLPNVFEHAKIPHSFKEVKKVITKISLHYTKIDVCLYDCMLYSGKTKIEIFVRNIIN